MIILKNLFKFSKLEVDKAFELIFSKKYYSGLTLLQSTAIGKDALHGKLLIITPRASGNATERNRIRRRIKSIFYEEHCYKKPTCWIILVTKKATLLSFEKLKTFLTTTMQ